MNPIPPETAYIMALNHLESLISAMDTPELEEIADLYLTDKICNGSIDLPQSIFAHSGKDLAEAKNYVMGLLSHKSEGEAESLAESYIETYLKPLTSLAE